MTCLPRNMTMFLLEMVKASYQNKKKPDEGKSLLQTIDFMIEKMEKKVEKEKRVKGTLSRWRATRSKMVDFLNLEYHIKDIKLDQIAYAFAEDFLEFLTLEQGFEDNTAMKYL